MITILKILMMLSFLAVPILLIISIWSGFDLFMLKLTSTAVIIYLVTGFLTRGE